ncbi:unnamed protein product [Acanthoscelides obtectus]|uniref:Uncharacterized protein n=1 Tax=Acanthoscelides obtectus TaxID=200917 RepID=A0A9P0K475_ACAOB|nr:unnamed protein product [Acanthoscelides obtectus]CAK1629687.1 hypothetical protein AOBTE_LOCUS5894 [Acanthoscelides obtectus]
MKPSGITIRKSMQTSMMPRKSLLKTPPKKHHCREKCPGCVSKRYKEMRKPKARLTKALKSDTEWTENESSKQEIQRAPSTDSIIYIGSYTVPEQYQNLPVVDLTSSQDDLGSQSKSLRTIYFPSRNFNRRYSLRKNLTTSSLVTLPIRKKRRDLKRSHSSSTLYKRQIDNSKLHILDIPEQYIDGTELDDQVDLSIADLNEVDHNMIEWMMQHENDSTSGYDSDIFDPNMSIEDMIKMYEMSSRDSFD